jgi:hypothetical protein
MAVIAVNEIWNGRKGTSNEKGEREYTRSFRVITDNALTSSVSVRNAAGIPRLFDVYADLGGDVDTGAVVRRITETQTEEPWVWEVLVEYSSNVQFEFNDVNPLLRPTEIKWGVNRFTRPFNRDLNLQPVRNSAGTAFDPLPEMDDIRLALTLTRNEASFDASVAEDYINSVNADIFFGSEPGKVKCSSISAERAFDKNTFYWKVTYEFEIKGLGWAFYLLDQGYMEKGTAPNTLVAMRDQFGAVLTSPTLLDGAGHKLAAGADPVYLTFDAYPSLPFANLRLP